MRPAASGPSPEGSDSALAAGYVEGWTEGYVYPASRRGTVGIKTYWNGTRSENLTTMSVPQPTGYSLVRTEEFGFAL